MARPFSSYDAGAVGPAIRAFAITPADGSDLTDDIRAVTLNAGGVKLYLSDLSEIDVRAFGSPAKGWTGTAWV